MTSNTGANIIQENFEKITDENRDEVIAKTRNQVFDVLRKNIRPEFLNRVDEIIMFAPLTRDEIKDIVKIQITQITNMLLNNGIALSVTDAAIDWLAQLGYDPTYGARPLKRVMQKKVLNELSKQIIAGTVNKDDVIEIDIDKRNEFVFRNIALQIATN